MGLLDNVKAKLGPAKGKVSDLALRHEDKLQHGLDRAAQVVDKRTKGKYSDRIHKGTGKAKEAMDRLAHKGEGGPDAGGTPAQAAPPPDAGGTPPYTTPQPDTGGTPPHTTPQRDTDTATPEAGGTPPPAAPPPGS
ncbi:antitoxin [Streptomyces sp. NPDC052682]|uniref:antitoxin n=1 Tax=Streptomyces sp. NPDC052682 TaxID=3154954 RepID=UPI00341DF792